MQVGDRVRLITSGGTVTSATKTLAEVHWDGEPGPKGYTSQIALTKED